LEGYLTEETPKESVHQVQHQALSCCEMMISLSRELEETKKEYQLVTDYLSDIQMLEELPEHEMTRLRDTAKNIISLDKARNEFVNKEQRLSDAQYMQMEQLEAEIPGDIRRMQANESYQSMIKRDMDNLEGEKSEWEYYLASLMKEKKMLKIGLFLLLPVFAAGVCILGYLQYVQYRDVLLWSMIFILAATVAGGGGVLRFQRDGREIKRAKASINRAITLTNQMKAKYVNESISSIAGVSEEISSSMAEMENQLLESTDFMRSVSRDMKNTTDPVADIERILDDSVKQMGAMTSDPFFQLRNQEFSEYVRTAINAHRTWLINLKKMVDSKSVMPLQLDSSKCGFGHFYYSITPKSAKIIPIWTALEAKHKRFHKYGSEVIEALQSEDYIRAEQLYREAEDYSKGLINDMDKMIQLSTN